MKLQKILVISVGRSDYDRYYPIVNELNKSKKIKVFIFATKAHQDPIFGNTINFIDKRFNILKNKYKNKSSKDLILSVAQDLIFLNEKIKKIRPDKIIVLGDRYEMLIGPIVAIPNNIPVIHFYGGAITEGATDELVRLAITKMSHFHFVLLPAYKKRVIQLGEEKWRVKSIGMHELNLMKNSVIISKERLKKRLSFNFETPFILITFHPVTIELKHLMTQLKSLFQAIDKSKLNVVITYPNADPKFLNIIKFINSKFNKKKFLIVKNCGREVYSSLLKHCKMIVGNSSSGIVEAASFKTPAINIGTRQKGKYKPINVIDTGYKSKEILKGIKLAQSKKFLNKLKKIKNPYESTFSIKKVIEIIYKLKKNDKILRKKFYNII